MYRRSKDLSKRRNGASIRDHPKRSKKVDDYGRVQYTISVINEKGQTTFQTFTTIKQLKEGTVIDLFVRGNEVRKYDIITKMSCRSG